MLRANEFLAGSRDDIFNPAKKEAQLLKYDLDVPQRIPITPELAISQMKKNLDDPLIGPDMKRRSILAQEVEDFTAEEAILEVEVRKASKVTLLYNQAVRQSEGDGFSESEKDQAMKQLLEDNSYEDVYNAQARKQKAFNENTKHLTDLRTRVAKLDDMIKKSAAKHRISTVEKIGSNYFVHQQRTTGIKMPRYLPQEISGHEFFKCFNQAENLCKITTERMIPIMRTLMESTPVEHHNDRMVLQHWMERLSSNKNITRMTFLKGIRSIFTEDLYADFRVALNDCLQSDDWRTQLDLPMDKDTRNLKTYADNTHFKMRDEKAVRNMRLMNEPIPNILKAAAQRIDARENAKKRQQKSGNQNGQNGQNGQNNRKRGRGGNGNGNGNNQGQEQKGQAQAGQEKKGGNNGGGNAGNQKKGGNNKQNQKKAVDQPRPQPPKVERVD